MFARLFDKIPPTISVRVINPLSRILINNLAEGFLE
jgi:hypothetical protein